MTLVCLSSLFKSPLRASRLAVVGMSLLLASFAISPAQAWAPRHVVEVECPPAYVALVYYHGQYYHRDAWVEWAHYSHLDFSHAQVYLFPASDFHYGKYVGPGAYPASKGYHHGGHHIKRHPVKMPHHTYH